MKKILSIFGTRPEAIKMAPVVRAVAAAPGLHGVVCVTGQHREMLDQVMTLFDLRADHDLDIMTPGQDLTRLTARMLTGLEPVLRAERPDVVLVHGDTTTAFVGALAAFYAGVPVGHVEAGLRTHDLSRPYPEEANRQLTGRLARHHFAPTASARDNLLREGVPEGRIHVTGNTVIDALTLARTRLPGDEAGMRRLLGAALSAFLDRPGRLILVTGHRRENFGAGFQEICDALARLAADYPGDNILYPVHANPQVHGPVHERLGGLPNLLLTEPVDYLAFVALLDRCTLVLTDSGGIQEEAPSFGKPVLVMRAVTERPEAVEAGTVRLVGASRAGIVAAVGELLEDPAAHAAMSRAHNPYGDGRAAARIADILAR